MSLSSILAPMKELSLQRMPGGILMKQRLSLLLRKEALNKSCIRQVAMISGSALQRRTLFFKTPSVIEQSALSMILILNTMEIMFLQRWRIGMMLLFILIKQPLSIHWQLKS
jgi:hypothetical protein